MVRGFAATVQAFRDSNEALFDLGDIIAHLVHGFHKLIPKRSEFFSELLQLRKNVVLRFDHFSDLSNDCHRSM